MGMSLACSQPDTLTSVRLLLHVISDIDFRCISKPNGSVFSLAEIEQVSKIYINDLNVISETNCHVLKCSTFTLHVMQLMFMFYIREVNYSNRMN